MDNQLTNQEPTNQEPINQESANQEPVVQPTSTKPETPPPTPTPEPPSETTPSSNQYQEVINQYAAAQPQPSVTEAPTPVPPQPPIDYHQIPTTNNFFKSIFIVVVIIFLLASGALGFVYYKNQKNSSITNQPPTIETTPTPAGSCFLNDKIYKVGEAFAAADGCNTCVCESQDKINCTSKECLKTSNSATPSATTLTPTKSATQSAKFNVSVRNPQGANTNDEIGTNLVTSPLKNLSVTFNNKADQKTINNTSFYVTDDKKANVSGAIAYDDKTNTASITFTNPVINTNTNNDYKRLIITVKNIKDISGNIIEPLTYYIDINK